MSRTRLPNRRPAVTETLEAAGQEFTVTVGYGEEGKPREIFMAAGKEGSAINNLLADAAVIISVRRMPTTTDSAGVLPGSIPCGLQACPGNGARQLRPPVRSSADWLAIGSISSGSSFFTLPTRVLTGNASMAEAGNGFSSVVPSTEDGSSHRS